MAKKQEQEIPQKNPQKALLKMKCLANKQLTAQSTQLTALLQHTSISHLLIHTTEPHTTLDRTPALIP